MKLIAMTFASDAEDKVFPATVTVVMSKDEALFVAAVMGRMKGTDADEVMRGGSGLTSSIYDCLVGDVFNRYWEDGVREAVRG